MIPFVIEMMNSVHSLPTILPTEFPLLKMTRFNYFFPTVIPSVYTEKIYMSLKSIENLPMKIFSR
jgi:hypothetical protein